MQVRSSFSTRAALVATLCLMVGAGTTLRGASGALSGEPIPPSNQIPPAEMDIQAAQIPFLIGGPHCSSMAPTIATDGVGWLVVWEQACWISKDIWGARVSSAAGELAVLDLTPFALCEKVNDQTNPALASDGTDYLVVWQDTRDGTYPDIYGTRVTGSGVAVDTADIPICVAQERQYNPCVAFGKTSYLVVWQDKRSGAWRIYGARVDRSGAVLDAEGFLISLASEYCMSPAVAFDGTNWLVVWEELRDGQLDIFGTRVNQAGTVLEPGGLPISIAAGNQQSPALTFGTTDYLVVWQDSRAGYSDIYAARVSKAFGVVDLEGKVVAEEPNIELNPTAAFDGQNYLVVWEVQLPGGNRYILSRRVTTAAALLDEGPIAVASNWDLVRHNPVVSCNGAEYVAVWEGDETGIFNIHGKKITKQGGTGVSCCVSMPNEWQSVPAAALGAGDYLVVWEVYRGRDVDVFSARVNLTGGALDKYPIPISASPGVRWQPDVASDGSDYLVVWEDLGGGDSDVFGARVRADGTVVETDGFLIAGAQGDQVRPAVAFDGTNYLVVWTDDRTGSCDIYGARVAPDGNVLDPDGFAIAAVPFNQRKPDLAFGGTGCVVVWADDRGGTWDIYGARVSPEGTVLDPEGIPVSTGPSDQTSPAVAYDGTGYLTVWEDSRAGKWDIVGARIARDGEVVDSAGFLICGASRYQRSPALAFGGVNYVVAWTDESSYDGTRVCGTEVTTEGIVISPDGTQMSAPSYFRREPAVARGQGCSVLVAYVLMSTFARLVYGNIWNGSTPVDIPLISASPGEGCIRLTWKTQTPASASSFLIQRSAEPHGVFETLDLRVTEETGVSFSASDCS
ncbi:MAG: hypothetical protein V2A71_03705, partial [Candidatus Eisenbacteria bacterium]